MDNRERCKGSDFPRRTFPIIGSDGSVITQACSYQELLEGNQHPTWMSYPINAKEMSYRTDYAEYECDVNLHKYAHDINICTISYRKRATFKWQRIEQTEHKRWDEASAHAFEIMKNWPQFFALHMI